MKCHDQTLSQRTVFSAKSVPKLCVSPTGPTATPIRMTKLVALLYTIRIGHYNTWGFLAHRILIFTFSIFFTLKWWLSATLAQVLFILFAWQAYRCPVRLH